MRMLWAYAQKFRDVIGLVVVLKITFSIIAFKNASTNLGTNQIYNSVEER